MLEKEEDFGALNSLGRLLMWEGAWNKTLLGRFSCLKLLWMAEMSMLKLKVARILRDGADGVAKDAGRAAECFRQVIGQRSDAKALVSLTSLAEKGDDGLKRDVVQAVTLYRSAIHEGHIGVQDLLDELLDGNGKRNYQEFHAGETLSNLEDRGTAMKTATATYAPRPMPGFGPL